MMWRIEERKVLGEASWAKPGFPCVACLFKEASRLQPELLRLAQLAVSRRVFQFKLSSQWFPNYFMLSVQNLEKVWAAGNKAEDNTNFKNGMPWIFLCSLFHKNLWDKWSSINAGLLSRALPLASDLNLYFSIYILLRKITTCICSTPGHLDESL